MKKYIAAVLLIGTAFTYNACNEKNLDVNSIQLSEEDYFKNEGEFEAAVFSIYSSLTYQYYWNNNAPDAPVYELPGDDVTSEDAGGYNGFEAFTQLNSFTDGANNFYTHLYITVNRANVVLQKLEQAGDGVYKDANLKDYHKGEALFLRGYAFYNLWNYFGTSPLVTKRVETYDDVLLGPSSGTQLLDQAIADFQEAADLLPASWSADNLGRVTSNSANGMLGKALVFRGSWNSTVADYTAALTAFDKITGRSLVANFGDNFSRSTENNDESLFEFQAGQSPGENPWVSPDFGHTIGPMSTASWLPFENINSWAYGNKPFIATDKVVDVFDVDDPRVPYSLDLTDKSIKKYVLNDQKINVGAGSLNNPRILRLADVKLLQAEALLQSGGSKSDAIAKINEVRARARAMVGGGTVPSDLDTGETNATTIMQWIMDERLRELAFESGRWLDIRRWHKQGIITLDKDFFSSANGSITFDPNKNLLFPIPQVAELDKNSNMKQNPGY